jgi:hypothetical protein
MNKVVAILIAAIIGTAIIPAFAQEEMAEETMPAQTNAVISNMVEPTEEMGETEDEPAAKEEAEQAPAAEVK